MTALPAVGFIGLGNVGGKLAGSLLRNGIDLTVRDLDPSCRAAVARRGAKWAESAAELAERRRGHHLPAVTGRLRGGDGGGDGVLAGWRPGQIWMEMSTTDEAEVRRLGALVARTRRQRPSTARSRAAATARPPATSRSSPAASAPPSSGCCRCSRMLGRASCTPARSAPPRCSR